MPEEKATVQDNATERAESTEKVGEPKGSDKEGGESEKKASGEKRTEGEAGLFDGMDAPTLHKSYKELQKEYSRIQNEIVKKFEPFGGPEQVLQWTNYLANNPDFAQWVTQQKTKSALGIDENQLDDQSKAALETVRKIARQVVADEVGKIRSQDIAPISEAHKQQLLESHFVKMGDKYGDDWHEMRDIMSELSEDLPESIQDRPKFEDIEDLYFKALRKTGKLNSYAEKLHKQKLTEKKSKATDKPTSASESAPRPSKSIAEAFAEAKRVHGGA